MVLLCPLAAPNPPRPPAPSPATPAAPRAPGGPPHLQTTVNILTDGTPTGKDCGKVCPTKQQEAVIAFKEQGQWLALRSRLSGVHCKACPMIFSNGLTWYSHCSDRSKQCGECYMAYAPEVDQDFLANELEADRNFRPAGQPSGPLPQGASDRNPFRPHRKFRLM